MLELIFFATELPLKLRSVAHFEIVRPLNRQLYTFAKLFGSLTIPTVQYAHVNCGMPVNYLEFSSLAYCTALTSVEP